MQEAKMDYRFLPDDCKIAIIGATHWYELIKAFEYRAAMYRVVRQHYIGVSPVDDVKNNIERASKESRQSPDYINSMLALVSDTPYPSIQSFLTTDPEMLSINGPFSIVHIFNIFFNMDMDQIQSVIARIRLMTHPKAIAYFYFEEGTNPKNFTEEEISIIEKSLFRSVFHIMKVGPNCGKTCEIGGLIRH